MIILYTVLAVAVLWFFETWVLGAIGMVLGLGLNVLMAPLYRQCRLDDEFAAEHPWRYHATHYAFWTAKVFVAMFILVAAVALVEVCARNFPSLLYWNALFVVALLASVQFFPNDANSLVLISAMSYRLRGMQPHLGRKRPQAGTVGPVYLPPLAVNKHQW